MYKIKNKQTVLQIKDGKLATYADLISLVVNVQVKGGVTIKEMKRDIGILTKFEDLAADAEVEVTDEELQHITAKVQEFKWIQGHVDLVNFEEYIVSLK